MTNRKNLTPTRSDVDLNARSNSYQYKLKELPWDFFPDAKNENASTHQFSNRDSINGHLQRYQYSEELLDLKEELLARFWRIANDVLTPLQLKVLTLYADGYTQGEIAKQLGWKGQSSAHKTIFGAKLSKKERERLQANTDNAVPEYYGGALKKLKAAFLEDSRIQELMRQIREIQEEIL